MTRAAVAVTATPATPATSSGMLLQRKCACGAAAEFDDACAECRKGKLQRKAARPSAPAMAGIFDEIKHSAGQPLDAATRAYFEPRFARDFGHVRIHTDGRAVKAARAAGAHAFTLGRSIVFDANQFAPTTRAGRHLLAHELTHVVQQQRTSGKLIQRVPSGTGEIHHQLAEQQRQSAGMQPGEGPSEGAIVYGNALRTVPDLPFFLVERLQPACTPAARPVQRQAAIDELAAWAHGISSLGVDWSRIDWIRFDTSVGATGSRTDAADPAHIKISLGPVAFSSVASLYSTFRHELVHVHEHETRPRGEVLARGWGVQEVYAYLWELEHQRDTGLVRRENWGLLPNGTADTSVGLARVIDGLMRSLGRFSHDLAGNPAAIPMPEQLAIERRIACAMTATPREVVVAVWPQAPLQQWQRECTQGVTAPQPKSRSGTPPEIALSPPDSPAEREAEDLAGAIMEGEAAVANYASPPNQSGAAPVTAGDTARARPLAPVAAMPHAIGQQVGPQLIMRQQAEGTGPSPPGEYDGCPDPQSLINTRADAAERVRLAIELLEPDNIGRAASLLERHFHLDIARPESAGEVELVRSQLGRMRDALNSHIRILCRSPPPFSADRRSEMPVGLGCGGTQLAYSTSCAGGDPTSTVTLCELGLLGMGDAPLVQTILHEFAHIACNGEPRISSGGRPGEVYYNGSRLPGDVRDDLVHADSYAWFAMQASDVARAAQRERQGRQGSQQRRLPWLAVLATGVALGVAGIFAPGLLVGAVLAGAIGLGGLLGLFD